MWDDIPYAPGFRPVTSSEYFMLMITLSEVFKESNPILCGWLASTCKPIIDICDGESIISFNLNEELDLADFSDYIVQNVPGRDIRELSLRLSLPAGSTCGGCCDTTDSPGTGSSLNNGNTSGVILLWIPILYLAARCLLTEKVLSIRYVHEQIVVSWVGLTIIHFWVNNERLAAEAAIALALVSAFSIGKHNQEPAIKDKRLAGATALSTVINGSADIRP